MARRRILYLAVLLAATIFYWAYQKWLSWLFLLTVLCLPVVSLVLSLPALFSLRIHMDCPTIVQRGNAVFAAITNKSWIPAPVYQCFIIVYKPLTGKVYHLKSAEAFPTTHCGKLACHIEKVEVSDYLGLFRFRLGTNVTAKLTVRPGKTVVTQLPQLQRQLASAWMPKPGGGYAENHEVRLYRPGDNLNQIHWKLSAKTGKLMIREPMIPMGQRAAVGLCLCGSEEELDLKFSRLMGIGAHLLDAGMPFRLHAVHSEGTAQYYIRTEEELTDAVDKLLGMKPAEGEVGLDDSRIYWIGGAADDR